MQKFIKYITIAIIGMAIFFGVIKLAKKEHLRFQSIKEAKSEVTIPYIAYVKTKTKAQDDTRQMEFFAQNYLVVKVPKDAHPTALIYKKEYPLILQKKQNNTLFYKTPLIPTKIDKKHVAVQLKFQKKYGYLIPKSSVIKLQNRYYVIIKENNSTNYEELHILKKTKKGYIVTNNLKNKEVATASPSFLAKRLQTLMQQTK